MLCRDLPRASLCFTGLGLEPVQLSERPGPPCPLTALTVRDPVCAGGTHEAHSGQPGPPRLQDGCCSLAPWAAPLSGAAACSCPSAPPWHGRPRRWPP